MYRVQRPFPEEFGGGSRKDDARWLFLLVGIGALRLLSSTCLGRFSSGTSEGRRLGEKCQRKFTRKTAVKTEEKGVLTSVWMLMFRYKRSEFCWWLCSDTVTASNHVRMLGVTFSANLSLDKHVPACVLCFFWLRYRFDDHWTMSSWRHLSTLLW